MKHQDLPDRWKSKVVEWLRARGVTDRDQLGALEFPSTAVELRLPDGSVVNFEHAFAIEAPELGEIGVFTEHCGYHVFPAAEARLSTS